MQLHTSHFRPQSGGTSCLVSFNLPTAEDRKVLDGWLHACLAETAEVSRHRPILQLSSPPHPTANPASPATSSRFAKLPNSPSDSRLIKSPSSNPSAAGGPRKTFHLLPDKTDLSGRLDLPARSLSSVNLAHGY
ncbi:unnamed protein product [Protopolystoma xenopodis]|uniref:Uncharacterized protein n=1 Tax=Protopolystoma xenopodis TaxID=117903 RepID=A0A448XMP8_9PLAT|nr:unnamed protein product [Protopolystoma xenopodis]